MTTATRLCEPDRTLVSVAIRALTRLVAGVVLGAALPAAASAQSATGDWTQGTTLNLLGAAAVDGSWTSGAAGAAFGWEVTPRFSMEGTGTWLARGPGADGFAADLTALWHITPPRRIVPFAKVGVGMYFASFDPTRSPMPDFYRDRLEPNAVFDQHATFTDPTIVAGGGFTAWLSRNVSLRPEADVKFVLDGGSAHPIAVIGVRFAYHFVDRPTESPSR
jgi:hypothetical protein